MAQSRALPVAYVVIRLLILLNWLYAAVVVAILTGLFTAPVWTMTALGVSAGAQSAKFLLGMRAIAALGLAAVPLSLAMLHRLVAMVVTVRRGDPFVPDNADRLNVIAWILLAQQFLSLIIAGVAKVIETPTHQLHLSAGFSPSGWLAVILAFVLARVFAEGSLIRDDLRGTI